MANSARQVSESPNKAANARHFCFPRFGLLRTLASQTEFSSESTPVTSDHRRGAGFNKGVVMKSVLPAAAAAAISLLGAQAAVAADLPVKALKAPVEAAFDPWDIAFGAGSMSDYVFRGITQSNHRPSVTAYFEPRYNVTKDLQFYVGSSFESISFPNRAAAEVDIYGGVRPTFGALALDFGVWGYLYPGGTCVGNGIAGSFGAAGSCGFDNQIVLANGNFLKKDVSFYEVYG